MFLDVLDFICDFPWTVSHFQMFARQLSGCHICGFTLKCGLMSLWIYTVHCPLIWSIKVVKWTTCKVPYIHRTCDLEYCGTIFKLPSMMSGEISSCYVRYYDYIFTLVPLSITSDHFPSNLPSAPRGLTFFEDGCRLFYFKFLTSNWLVASCFAFKNTALMLPYWKAGWLIQYWHKMSPATTLLSLHTCICPPASLCESGLTQTTNPDVTLGNMGGVIYCPIRQNHHNTSTGVERTFDQSQFIKSCFTSYFVFLS